MAGSKRITLAIVAFLGLLALFLLIQREDNESEPSVEPGPAGFEPQQGEPELVEMPAGRASGSSVQPEARRREAEPYRESQRGASTPPGGQMPGSVVDPARQDSASIGGSSMPSFGQDAAIAGPGAGVDPAMPVQEMISLPASGPGPDPVYDGSAFEAPEHAPADSAIAPEAGSSGIPTLGPELLPVTHPGPAGEMPTQPAPSEGP